jgi:hypothetical protein
VGKEMFKVDPRQTVFIVSIHRKNFDAPGVGMMIDVPTIKMTP